MQTMDLVTKTDIENRKKYKEKMIKKVCFFLVLKELRPLKGLVLLLNHSARYRMIPTWFGSVI
jgi:hypothetical protein